MSDLFKKLNLKNQSEILVLQPPRSFEKELEKLEDVQILRDLNAAAKFDFVLAFVTSEEEIDRWTNPVKEKAPGDAVIWFAYPKTSSKKYQVNINRDRGWDALEDAGFKPVRQVSIDQDWSALRFRRKSFVGQ